MKQTMRTQIVLMGAAAALGFGLLMLTGGAAHARWAVAVLGLGLLMLTGGSAYAHCDTMIGPVVTEAKAALDKGDVTPILKWVLQENEEEIKAAFAKTLTVRDKGPEAKELADNYFFETLVRIHRAGEGVAYSGLKDEPVARIIAMSDKALADGSADEMITELSNHMTAAIKEKFDTAVEAGKNKDKSVNAGREFVEAYVIYTHHVEGIHAALTATGAHHAEVEQSGTGHNH